MKLINEQVTKGVLLTRRMLCKLISPKDFENYHYGIDSIKEGDLHVL